MKTLYLFTGDYPFGTKESFLETEISYLCSKFPKVVIVPMQGMGTRQRPVPDNCEVFEPIRNTPYYKYLHALSLRRFPFFLKEFFEKKVYHKKSRLRNFLIMVMGVNNYLESPKVKKILSKVSKDDVFYSYWGKAGCILAPFVGNKVKHVSRFHGDWDLWGSCDDYAPIREQVVANLDLAAFISEEGLKYFNARYYCKRTIVSRLGTINKDKVAQRSTDGVIRIVSCSRVYDVKRLDLIYQATQLFENEKVEWTHIGDGPDLEKMRELAIKSRQNVKVNFIGSMSNAEVLEYYQSHPCDVFVNVSSIEGVPVSIMEAISYNIPAVGTDVGATREVVTPQSGILISSNPTVEEIKDAIFEVIHYDFTPREQWEERFNAEINYSNWANILFDL